MSKQERPPVVVTDEGVTCYDSDGTEYGVAWRDLIEVAIVTTDQGPFVEDVFLNLKGAGNTGCYIGQALWDECGVFARIEKLTGFDWQPACEAMRSTRNARFVCWRRPS